MTKTGLSSAEMSFYTTAAAVIPVFMITLAVEARATTTLGDYFSVSPARPSGSSPGWLIGKWLIRFAVFAIYCLMFTGEVLSLLALKDNDVTPGTGNWVIAALIAGAVLAFLGLLHLALGNAPVPASDRGVDAARERERDPQTRMSRWVWSGLALAAIALGRTKNSAEAHPSRAALAALRRSRQAADRAQKAPQ
jgi:hypothetical protein